MAIRISFKYAILAPIFGAVVVGGMMLTAPLLLRVISPPKAVPSDAEVCTHLASVGVNVPDCPAWLSQSKADYGAYNDHRLRCYAAAADLPAARRCEDPVVYMSDTWGD